MQRVLIAAVAGLLCGAAATAWLLGTRPTADSLPPRDLVAAATASELEVANHRAEQFVKIESIEQVLSLPGTFARAEALYAIAGRSDSAGVQGLLFDANRVADRDVRRNLLAILLERLTELDPASALALSRSGQLANDSQLERGVWIAWARRDLDAAIAAANALPSRAERDRAAQAMFAASGYYGNDEVARIERDTGSEPNLHTLTEYLYELADTTVADAIRFIELEAANDQRPLLARRLAAHLAAVDPDRAAGFATLFRDESLRRDFQASVTREHATLDPDAYLPQLLPGGTRPDSGTVHVVLRELVDRDLAAAMDIVGRLSAPQDRESLSSLIAQKLAETDPLRAFEWARSQPGRRSEMFGTVLGTIARDNVELALELAGQVENRMERYQAMYSAVNSVSHRDPAKAAELTLALNEDATMRGMLPHMVVRWLQEDRNAALAWIRNLDPEQRTEVLSHGGANLVQRDPELAISLLPVLDGSAAAELRRSIVTRLAASGSVDRARDLIAQMPAGEDADGLRAALASGVARRDVVHARQLIDEIADSRTRDQAYSNLVQLHGMTDPVAAIAMLGAIGDVRVRASSAVGPVGEWYLRDAEAAERWIASQPGGMVRDSAIMAVAGQWTEPTASQQRLLESIEDDDMRYRANLQRLYAIAQRDPLRARTLLDTLDLPQRYRDDLQGYLDARESGTWYLH